MAPARLLPLPTLSCHHARARMGEKVGERRAWQQGHPGTLKGTSRKAEIRESARHERTNTFPVHYHSGISKRLASCSTPARGVRRRVHRTATRALPTPERPAIPGHSLTVTTSPQRPHTEANPAPGNHHPDATPADPARTCYAHTRTAKLGPRPSRGHVYHTARLFFSAKSYLQQTCDAPPKQNRGGYYTNPYNLTTNWGAPCRYPFVNLAIAKKAHHTTTRTLGPDPPLAADHPGKGSHSGQVYANACSTIRSASSPAAGPPVRVSRPVDSSTRIAFWTNPTVRATGASPALDEAPAPADAACRTRHTAGQATPPLPRQDGPRGEQRAHLARLHEAVVAPPQVLPVLPARLALQRRQHLVYGPRLALRELRKRLPVDDGVRHEVQHVDAPVDLLFIVLLQQRRLHPLVGAVAQRERRSHARERHAHAAPVPATHRSAAHPRLSLRLILRGAPRLLPRTVTVRAVLPAGRLPRFPAARPPAPPPAAFGLGLHRPHDRHRHRTRAPLAPPPPPPPSRLEPPPPPTDPRAPAPAASPNENSAFATSTSPPCACPGEESTCNLHLGPSTPQHTATTVTSACRIEDTSAALAPTQNIAHGNACCPQNPPSGHISFTPRMPCGSKSPALRSRSELRQSCCPRMAPSTDFTPFSRKPLHASR